MKKKINNLLSIIYNQSSKKGFTLIELLVVIAIISILTAFLMSNFVGVRQRGRDAERKSDLRQIQSALEMYRADQGYYPDTSDLSTCGGQFVFGSTVYMQKIPCDPQSSSGNSVPYVYVATPTNCNNTSTYCTNYTIYTCLENTNDLERDEANNRTVQTCSNGTKSFTVANP